MPEFLFSLLKKRLWHMRSLVNFAKFLRTTFLTEHLQWLLLKRDSCIFSLKNTETWLSSASLKSLENLRQLENSVGRGWRRGDGGWNCKTLCELCKSLYFSTGTNFHEISLNAGNLQYLIHNLNIHVFLEDSGWKESLDAFAEQRKKLIC